MYTSNFRVGIQNQPQSMPQIIRTIHRTKSMSHGIQRWRIFLRQQCRIDASSLRVPKCKPIPANATISMNVIGSVLFEAFISESKWCSILQMNHPLAIGIRSLHPHCTLSMRKGGRQSYHIIRRKGGYKIINPINDILILSSFKWHNNYNKIK